ncbi:MAG: hypothetical protein AAF658_22685, partial [Myxococcota bacterium]
TGGGPATLRKSRNSSKWLNSLRVSRRVYRKAIRMQWARWVWLVAAGVAAPAWAQESEDTTPTEPATENSEESADAESSDVAATKEMPSSDEASFNIQLRGLQERVDELKQKVYKSKARLTQLKEVVMHGAITGAKARLTHKNEMGSSFKLKRIQYSLDGAPILNRTDNGDGSLDDVEELEVFDGSIAPGEHQISVYLEYSGDGYGIFSYLKNYTFKIKSSYSFTADEGKLTNIDIVGYEKGNFTTELKDRLAVRYDQSVERATRGKEAAPADDAPKDK